MRQVRQGSSPKRGNTRYKPVDARGHLQTAENYRQHSELWTNSQLLQTSRDRLGASHNTTRYGFLRVDQFKDANQTFYRQTPVAMVTKTANLYEKLIINRLIKRQSQRACSKGVFLILHTIMGSLEFS